MEAAILAPAVVLLVLFVTLVGRIQSAQGVVDAAARAGARAATISVRQDPETAKQQAEDAMNAVLKDGGVSCAPLTVGDPTFRLDGPDGLQTVEVTIGCDVPVGDLLLLNGGWGHKHLASGFVSVVDRYREQPGRAAP
ncbi:hypothetical protein CFP65_6419 [Kitasatospora sp. MMS16-BH015]|uniref:TadE/TadG family type IV pilus assembly protein n=1 Tax=Kitasatospora sp. MMS16-BH015 TaxID=2018025 RepID=UPI000CA322F2|nr:TadE/TadG family type IV pilus assembly protein [Kitasatospora sp. MMS16-BH015]AUG81075.1 hypothetical protein CFP65_6419 [Kitasatospora sp. MMS16-BH015]